VEEKADVSTKDAVGDAIVTENAGWTFGGKVSDTFCPVILNTSFNVKGQPIVNTPDEALHCFLDTKIDVLVMGDFLCFKAEQPRDIIGAKGI